MSKNSYFKSWRNSSKNLWNYTQLVWYYTFKNRVLAGQRKPTSDKPDEYDKWAMRHDRSGYIKPSYVVSVILGFIMGYLTFVLIK